MAEIEICIMESSFVKHVLVFGWLAFMFILPVSVVADDTQEFIDNKFQYAEDWVAKKMGRLKAKPQGMKVSVEQSSADGFSGMDYIDNVKGILDEIAEQQKMAGPAADKRRIVYGALRRASPDAIYNVVKNDALATLDVVKNIGACLVFYQDIPDLDNNTGRMRSFHGTRNKCAQQLAKIKAELEGGSGLFGLGCIEPSVHTIALDRFYTEIERAFRRHFKNSEGELRHPAEPLSGVRYCA